MSWAPPKLTPPPLLPPLLPPLPGAPALSEPLPAALHATENTNATASGMRMTPAMSNDGATRCRRRNHEVLPPLGPSRAHALRARQIVESAPIRTFVS
jgi:hypothetical protein